MTTKTAGGKITGLLALTCEAQEAIEVGEPVMLTGDYEVEINDGTKPVLGHVSVANVTREAGTGRYPVANVPGDCTVEARGLYVRRVVAGDAVDAGVFVKVVSGKYEEWVASGVGADTADKIAGLSLMAAAAEDDEIDVLF